MDSKILINYATRGRPNAFKKAIQNIYDTVVSDNYVILVKVDEDDESMKWLSDADYKNMVISVGNSKSKIEAINKDISLIPEWDILVNMSDDMHFIQNGWDNIVRESMKEGFFLHFPDGFVNERLTTLSIISKEYYDLDGYVYYGGYKSESCDAEAMYVAMMRGMYKYINTLFYKHIHPCNIGSYSDATYERNGVHAKGDHALYFERMKNKFFLTEKDIKFVPDVVKQYQ
jgi:hypothetical protein